MVLMGDRGTKYGHYTITPVLIYRAFVSVDFFCQDLEASIHDMVHVFRIKPLSHGGKIGHIGKDDRHLFSLPLKGALGSEDIFC